MTGYDTIPRSAQLQPTKFTLSVPDQELSDFKTLLRLSKLAPHTYENQQTDGSFGVSHEWMSQTKEYWESKYDWRETERHINSFPNFTVDIKDDEGENFKIHFAALFSKKQDAVPILFMHGWPGSHLEFLGIMDLLRKRYSPDDLPYHIITPSLPGYTLSSGPPVTKDFQMEDVARILNKLMVGLGFGSGYVSQGGDIGSFVAKILAAKYDECKAFHLNFCLGGGIPEGLDQTEITEAETTSILTHMERFGTIGNGYAHEHGTRPATIGFTLSSSPIALLAWIGEKFIEWTDDTPPLKDILDSITLYWFTQSFPRSIYPYREVLEGTPHSDPRYNTTKPYGLSSFPKELVGPVPKRWAALLGNLAFYRLHDSGGHFAALEKPDLLLADVEEFVQKVWPPK